MKNQPASANKFGFKKFLVQQNVEYKKKILGPNFSGQQISLTKHVFGENDFGPYSAKLIDFDAGIGISKYLTQKLQIWNKHSQNKDYGTTFSGTFFG